MTRSTASRLVDELLSEGFVQELDTPNEGKAGRPATPLSAAHNTVVGLGLEVNVGILAARTVDLTGAVVTQRSMKFDSREGGPFRTLFTLAQLGSECLDELPSGSRVVGSCVALPGLVDPHLGRLLKAPNLGWRDIDVASVLRASGLHTVDAVIVQNEADCAATTVAQVSPGNPSPLQDFLYLSGEVGIGSAIIQDGEAMRGYRGWAGEIGHFAIDPNGPRCGCGASGCLEVYAGQAAMCRAARASSLEALKSQAQAADARTLEVIDRAGRALGLAISGAMNLLDLPTVVLGGHLGELSPLLEPTMTREIRMRVLSSSVQEVQVVPVGLDVGSSATGAAHLVLDRLIVSPADFMVGSPLEDN